MSETAIEKDALTADRAVLEEQRRKLRQKLGLSTGEDPDAARRKALIDPTGVHYLTLSQCQELLSRLMNTREGALYFSVPVDPVKHNVPDYPAFVKHPMDFGTIRQKMNKHAYDTDTDQFLADVRLVFRNCEVFNHPDHESVRMARRLSYNFEEAIRDPSLFNKVGPKSRSKSSSSKSKKAVGSSRSSLSSSSSRKRSKNGDSEDDFDAPVTSSSKRDHSMEFYEFSNQMLKEVRSFCDALLIDPTLLQRKKVSFFRDFLKQFPKY